MSEVTTFCSLWTLEITSGQSIYLTDHDDLISYGGNVFLPQNGADASLSDIRNGLAVDSGGIQTMLVLPNISPDDIRGGALDGAQLSQFRHDWRSGETTLLSKGRVGDVSISGDAISIEWLGQASLLDRTTGRVFSRQCDASFGDSRCGLRASDFSPDTTCSRHFQTCRDQFSNTANFRGFPYLLGDDVLQAGVSDSVIRDGSSRYQ